MSNLLDLWKSPSINPFRELNQLQRAMDRVFDDMSTLNRKSGGANLLNPSCEVSEDKSSYLVRFDLPGIPKDQIKIELDENRLTVSGERKEEKNEEDSHKKKHLSEMYYGSFYRSFTLPTAVDAEKSTASYDHGVLSISIPKAGGNKSRQIAVK